MEYRKAVTLKDGRTCILRNGTGREPVLKRQRTAVPGSRTVLIDKTDGSYYNFISFICTRSSVG